MAKIFKISGYLVDNRGYFETGEVIGFLKGTDYGEYPATFGQHIHVEEAEFEWDADLPINYENCDLAHCEAYFKPVVAYDEGSLERGIPNPGEVWKHFKEGKKVTIIAVSKHSEHPSQLLVTYECPNGIYTRPLDMFMSKVDKEKYPDAKQEWRFERVEGEWEWM